MVLLLGFRHRRLQICQENSGRHFNLGPSIGNSGVQNSKNSVTLCEHQVTISRKKFTIGPDISFAGFVISDQGIKPDPQKTIAIASFASPKNITDLRSFLGLAYHLAFFLPDFSHLTCEMRKLLSTKNAFLWLDIHETEFKKLKDILTSDLLVKKFNP